MRLAHALTGYWLDKKIRLSPREITSMLAASGQNAPRPAPGGQPYSAVRPTALRDRAMLLTLIDTGVHTSELCNLKVGDFDAERNQFRIRQGKRRKDRIVYVGAMW